LQKKKDNEIIKSNEKDIERKKTPPIEKKIESFGEWEEFVDENKEPSEEEDMFFKSDDSKFEIV